MVLSDVQPSVRLVLLPEFQAGLLHRVAPFGSFITIRFLFPKP